MMVFFADGTIQVARPVEEVVRQSTNENPNQGLITFAVVHYLVTHPALAELVAYQMMADMDLLDD